MASVGGPEARGASSRRSGDLGGLPYGAGEERHGVGSVGIAALAPHSIGERFLTFHTEAADDLRPWGGIPGGVSGMRSIVANHVRERCVALAGAGLAGKGVGGHVIVS